MYAFDEDCVEGNLYNGNAHSENGFVSDGELEVNEYLESINDDFIPRKLLNRIFDQYILQVLMLLNIVS